MPPSNGFSGTQFIFKLTQNEDNDPKGPKIYNVHYDDVRGDVLRPPHAQHQHKFALTEFYITSLNLKYVLSLAEGS